MSQTTPETSSGRPARRAVISLAITALVAVLAFVLVPPEAYLWVKSVHIFALIAWMAAMLYLPRLFVYHAEAGPGTPQSETFKVMERRLLRGIGNPSMIVTWVAGLWLAWNVFQFQGAWLHAKIVLVILLSGIHGFYSASVRRFAEDRNTRSSRFWRVWNEAPAVLLVFIIILVVVKPF